MVREERPLPECRGRESGGMRREWNMRILSLIAISCVIFSGAKYISFSFKNAHDMSKDVELLSTAKPESSISTRLQQDGKSNRIISPFLSSDMIFRLFRSNFKECLGIKLKKLISSMSAAEPAMEREEELAQAETHLDPILKSRPSLMPIKRYISLQRIHARLGRAAEQARRAAVEKAESLAAQRMTIAAEHLAEEVSDLIIWEESGFVSKDVCAGCA